MSGALLGESTLLVQYASRYPKEFTTTLRSAEAQQTLDLLNRLPEHVLPAVVAHLPRQLAKEFLATRADAAIVNWLTESPLMQALRMSRRIQPARLADLSPRLPTRRRNALHRYSEFPENTLGTLADADYASIRDSDCVGDAVDRLRDRPMDSDAPLLVVDDSDRLIGLLDSRKALLLGAKRLVRECLVPTRSFPASIKLHTLLARPEIHQQAWLVVVDDHRRPIGLVSYARLVGIPTRIADSQESDLAALAAMMLDVWAELPLISSPNAGVR